MSLGVEKHELKNKFRRLALAGVFSAVVGPWERRMGHTLSVGGQGMVCIPEFPR